MTDLPRVIHDDDRLMVAVWSKVVVNRWRDTPTQDKLALLGKLQGEIAGSMEDGRVLSLTVISPEAGILLDSAARKEAERLARVGRQTLLALAHVVEGTGFAAATTRAVISGVQLAVRPGYPVKVFSTIDEAMPWMEQQLIAVGHADVAAGIRDGTQSIRG